MSTDLAAAPGAAPYPTAMLHLGELRTPEGPLTLQSVEIDAELRALSIEARLRQSFANRFDSPLEATYVFGLPDRLAVRDFRMHVAERTVVGKVLERSEARESYEEAIATGTRAAIVEEERPGTFTVRVGRIAPGEVATVELVLCGPAAIEGGEATLRFPLTVAPRYSPGRPLSDPTGTGTHPDTVLVPDASRISPPMLAPGERSDISVSATVRVHGLRVLADQAVRCSRPARIRQEDGSTVVHLDPGQEPDEDLVIRVPFGARGLAAAGLTDGRVSDRDVAAVWVVPPIANPDPRHPTSQDARRKDVVVLLDRSGSMDGWKIVAARRAAGRLVDALGPRDRVAVAAFDSTLAFAPVAGADCLESATDRHRFALASWLGGVEARGGTELTTALTWALRRLQAPRPSGAARVGNRHGGPEVDAYSDAGPVDRVLVLVTDAQIGDEDHALREAGPLLGGVRVLGVAIDTAPNAAFLRRLAAHNGRIDVVESQDRLDEVLTALCRDVVGPALLDVSVTDDDGNPLTDVSGTGDVFTGSPLLVTGRIARPAPDALPRAAEPGPVLAASTAAPPERAVRVQGRLPDGTPWSERVVLVPAGDSVRFAWARARLRDLEDAYAAQTGAVDPEQIVSLSVREQVLCRFTAFLAVDTSGETVDGRLRRIDQPVAAPSGWQLLQSAPREAAPPPQVFASGPPPVPPYGAARAAGGAAPSPKRAAARSVPAVGAESAAPAGGSPDAPAARDAIALLETLWQALTSPNARTMRQLAGRCRVVAGAGFADRGAAAIDQLWSDVAALLERLSARPDDAQLAGEARDVARRLADGYGHTLGSARVRSKRFWR